MQQIMLVDGHRIVRQGLRALLEKEADVEVVAEASTGGQAVTRAHQHQPDLIFMDLNMPGLNGLEATRQIKKAAPQIHVVILSQYADLHVVANAFSVGAAGYLLKSEAVEELIQSLRTVIAGQIYLSRALVDRVEVGSFNRGVYVG